jgi:hypothetical protein
MKRALLDAGDGEPHRFQLERDRLVDQVVVEQLVDNISPTQLFILVSYD